MQHPRASVPLTESIMGPFAKTSILCEEGAGCYCNTFDGCQTGGGGGGGGVGLDDSCSAVDARLNTKTMKLQRKQTEETKAVNGTLC